MALAVAVLSGSIEAGKPAMAFDLGRSAWSKVAAEYGLDPYLLYAVALVESRKGKEGGIAPSPFAIATASQSFQPSSREEAIRILDREMRNGRNVAIGLMQISLKDHGRQVEHAVDLFDPLKNLRLGARVLNEGLQTDHPEIAVRIGRYNAWQRTDVARLYGQRVLGVCGRLRQLARASGARVRPSLCESAYVAQQKVGNP
ncbi:transglycosylase SLT domain-containing protein (plasmid) [Azospirillum sp. HJ39]|uniref:transglycosylase SLT domain-containing protein n=1 Tax=Azospirillum sp. HJ39 TaxID=3159496 RepID=UPI003558E4C6